VVLGQSLTGVIAAHTEPVTHHYQIRYPDHFPRETDPHYVDFNAFHRAHHATAKCAVGEHRNDYSECDESAPMELHHAHIEFALQNGVNLAWLEVDYPGVSSADEVGAWVETGANFVWYCVFHHRGHGGAHVASAADFEAEKYVRGLIQ
jgi:hypothetical protein